MAMRLALPTDKLEVGQKIAIHRDVNNYYRPNRVPLEGTVLSAHYYYSDGSKESGAWYIEATTTEFGYSYWKQDSDGGELYIETDNN